MLRVHNYNNFAEEFPLQLDGDKAYREHNYDGRDKLEFEIQRTNEIYQYIQEEVVVDGFGNRFVVKNVDEHSDFVTVTCELDFIDWKQDVKLDFRPTNSTVVQVVSQLLPTGWSAIYESGVDVTKRTTVEEYEGQAFRAAVPYDILPKVSEAFGVVFNFNAITKVLTVINPDSYTSSGEFFSEDVNLRSLGFTGNTEEFATRLYAYGKKDPTTGEYMTFASINDGKPYVENNAYATRVIAVAWVDERYTVPENLYNDALKKLADIAAPFRSYECEVNNFDEDFWLYKVVTLIDRNRKKRIDHQVVSYREYEDHGYDVCTLSQQAPSITARIKTATEAVQEVTRSQVFIQQYFLSELQRQSNMITGSTGGSFRWILDADDKLRELVNLGDTDDINTAQKVWRWNAGGLGHSNNGYNGTYALALTADGAINASMITVGILNAVVLRAGTIQDLTGTNWWDLETGQFHFELTTSDISNFGTELSGAIDANNTILRTEFSSAISSAIADLPIGNPNLVVNKTLVEGKVVYGDGTENDPLSTMSRGFSTDYIPIPTVQADQIIAYTLQVWFPFDWSSGTANYRVNYFDANKDPLAVGQQVPPSGINVFAGISPVGTQYWSRSLSIPTGTTYVRISVQSSVDTSDDRNIYIKFEEGSQATAYNLSVEDQAGIYAEIAKTNTSIEQTAQAVTIEAKSYTDQSVNAIETVNRNLYIMLTATGGYVNSSGTFISRSDMMTSDYIEVDPDTDYRFSAYSASPSSIQIWMSVVQYDENKNFISGTYQGGYITAPTTGYRAGRDIHTQATAKYIRCTAGLDTAQNNAWHQVKVEKGSKVTYYTLAPEDQVTYPVFETRLQVASDQITLSAQQYTDSKVANENLIVGAAAEIGKYLKADGTLDDNSVSVVTDYIPVTAETRYTYHQVRDDTTYFSWAVAYYDSSKTFISRVPSGAGTYTSNGYTGITPPANTAYVRIQGMNLPPIRMKLELGNTKTAYIPAPADNAVMFAELKVTSTEVSSKVGVGEIISRINQSAETILINASKINLAGYVTVSSLGSGGTTVIDGSRIQTGTISAITISGVTINASTLQGTELILDGVYGDKTYFHSTNEVMIMGGSTGASVMELGGSIGYLRIGYTSTGEVEITCGNYSVVVSSFSGITLKRGTYQMQNWS